MPLGLANNDSSAYLKKVEQEVQQLQLAVLNGEASERELSLKEDEYEMLKQRQEAAAKKEQGLQQQLMSQGMKMGMNQLNGGGTGFDMFGGGGQPGGGAGGSAGAAAKAIPVAGGVLSGTQAGDWNYRNDPNMTNKKDGFGTNSPDLRAHVGGGVLGGVLGYFGGPAGAAVAGPAVKLAHPIMEPATRTMIKFGDSWGGPGGALMMDPVGTISSGKYSVGQLAKGLFLGPFSKLIK